MSFNDLTQYTQCYYFSLGGVAAPLVRLFQSTQRVFQVPLLDQYFVLYMRRLPQNHPVSCVTRIISGRISVVELRIRDDGTHCPSPIQCYCSCGNPYQQPDRYNKATNYKAQSSTRLNHRRCLALQGTRQTRVIPFDTSVGPFSGPRTAIARVLAVL